MPIICINITHSTELLRGELKYSQSMELMELSRREEETYFSRSHTITVFAVVQQHRQNPPKWFGITMVGLTYSGTVVHK